MHNVLLVDDEPWILKDMERIIDWDESGFRIVAKVNDANAAESLIKRQRIDVLISDIRMPGKSGLDLLGFVNRVSPDTLVVFMSAYSEFSYAKQALEKGCFHYLLKPVNVGELQMTLDRCQLRLAEKDKERNARRVADQTMKFLEGIERDSTIRCMVDTFEPFGLPFKEHSRFMFATVKSSSAIGDEELNPFHSMLRNYGYSYWSGRFSPSKWSYLVGVPKVTPNVYKSIYKDIVRVFKERGWDVGLSSWSDSNGRAGRLYHQSNMMADTSTLNNKIGLYRYRVQVNADVPALRERIGKASRLEHLEAALIDVHRGIDAGRVHLSGLAELYNLFVSVIANLSSRDVDSMDSNTTQDLVLNYGNPHDLLEDIAMMIAEQKKKPDDSNAQLIVEEITRELDRLYAHRISLRDLAQKYFISPNYLSHLFKQEKGLSFINYLIQKRLDAAIALLEKDISLYEVARMVGYDDYAHFSKLFKKHVGQSPVDYKQRKLRHAAKAD